jgi:quinohemoprotein amine dehydrogenase
MFRNSLYITFLSLLAAFFLVSCTGQEETSLSNVEASFELLKDGNLTSALKGEKLIVQRCSGCHQKSPEGGLSRISQQRKTPEGWFMTVVRMEREGRVVLSDDERRAIVKHLSDKQGLSPMESKEYRWSLEKRPNVVAKSIDSDMDSMCARCHSNSRYSLQRRTEEEWGNLVHFHVAQFPTLEYAMSSRDRDWWGLATTKVVSHLASQNPLNAASWDNWLRTPKNDLSGQWRVVGRRPGSVGYTGFADIQHAGLDNYVAEYSFKATDGREWKASSEGLVYTGYEWRGETSVDGDAVREVFEVSEDGTQMKGRWFKHEHDEIGGTWHAVRVDAEPQVMSVYPEYVKVGETSRVTITGVGLQGSVDFGDEAEVQVIDRSKNTITLDLTFAVSSSLGKRNVQVGSVSKPLITVYEKIDAIKVHPENAIARLGGGGGKIAPVSAQFEAVGYLAGPDGKPQTKDDVRIGVFPAVWTKDNYDEVASALEDAKFTGEIDKNGLFKPAEAGINGQRYIPTNNAGVLSIIATVMDGENSVRGKSRLVVTVQRFIDPPIR